MALRRLGWTVPAPAKVNDRIVRMAQEQAGRALRSVKWRADLASGVLATWPGDAAKRTPQEWDAVRAAVPGGAYLPSSTITSRTRQIATFERKNGHLPADVFELEPTPRLARILLLAACDGQQATIERSSTEPAKTLLRLQLPLRPDPQTYKDWTWVACPITLPPTIPANAVLHLPTLRVVDGKIRADLAHTHPVPKTQRTGHTVALGVDWGLNTLLSSGAVRLHDDGTITALGAGAQYRAAGALAKQYRLRRTSERLHTKTDHHARLADPALESKTAALTREIHRVSKRRSNLNDALAWSAARWTVDQAIAAKASVIYLEDLRSMEAGGMGRTSPRYATAKPPTGPPRRAGSGRSAPTRSVVGRATATTGPGAGSPHAASPTRPRPSPTAPPAPRRSAPSWTRWRSRPSSRPPPRPAGRTGRRPAPPGREPTASRPGDVRFPPRHGPPARSASVRRDTHQRTGPDCPAQPTGTRA
jgi:hypothetical protein